MGLISNSYRIECSTNFLIMAKRKYGAMLSTISDGKVGFVRK